MKKIVIIGALGYLGTEISKIYSGESWRNKIIAIDNRFISERVKQLKDWNIEFFQGEILDRKFLKGHLHDADIVHHLAGVTDVAYTKVEANSTLDKKIKSISIEGTKNILDIIPNKCKIIFPSTHVVFEGLKKIKKNILKIKEKNNIIVGYGAPAKASTLINFFGISDDIDYVIDDNTLKNKKFIPGTNLQILNKPKLSNIKLIVIFAWNYFDEIKKKISSISSKIISIKDLEKL